MPRNALAIIGSRVSGAAGAFVTAAIVADRLGSADFGRFAAVLAAAALAHVVLTLGLDTLVVRAVADDEADGAATAVAALRFRTLGALAAIALAAVIVGLGAAPPAVLVAALGLVPVGIHSVASAVLRGAQRMGLLATTSMVTAVLTVGGALAVVDESVTGAVAVTVVAALPGTIALAWRAASLVDLAPALRTPVRAHVGSDAAVLAGATAASAVIATGSIITFELLGDGDAGGLAAGLRLLEGVRLVPAAAFGALFPAMFAGVHRSGRYRQAFTALLAYGVVATAALIAAAPWLTSTFFGDATDAVVATRILALAALTTPFRLRWSFELIAGGRERTVLEASGVAAGVAVVGYVGGALAGSVAAVAVVQVAAGVLHAALLWRASRSIVSGDGAASASGTGGAPQR
ncbi:MAG: oligosaccharide flippase family protein [Actinomycetota bacterium]